MSEALFDKRYICLYCNKEFTTKKTLSRKLKIKKRDSDSCIHYDGVSPYFYEVNVCSSCGFAFTENYKKPYSPFVEILEKQYLSKIKGVDLNQERDLEDAIKSFKLALVTANILREHSVVIGGICLKLAWLYRYEGNKEEETRFLKNALDKYIETYENDKLDGYNVEEDLLIYRIAEIYIQLDEYTKARRWFSILISSKDVSDKIKKLAQERWYEYKYDQEREE